MHLTFHGTRRSRLFHSRSPRGLKNFYAPHIWMVKRPEVALRHPDYTSLNSHMQRVCVDWCLLFEVYLVFGIWSLAF